MLQEAEHVPGEDEVTRTSRSRSWPPATSRRVSARSSALGVLTPPGWLWARRIDAAPRSSADRKRMRESTTVLAMPPDETILKPVM